MNKQSFTKYLAEIEKFKEERQKFKDCMDNVIDGNFTVKFGDHFIQAYIELLSKSVGDRAKWVEWHVYENDMGKNELRAYGSEKDVKGKKVKNGKDLYDIIKNSSNE